MPRSATVTTQEPSDALIIYREQFVSFIEKSPKILLDMAAVLSRRLRKVNELIRSLAFFDVYGKVARVLLNLATERGRQTERGTVIDLRLTQQELAELAGMSRETMTRTLRDFQQAGCVSIDSGHYHHSGDRYAAARNAYGLKHTAARRADLLPLWPCLHAAKRVDACQKTRYSIRQHISHIPTRVCQPFVRVLRRINMSVQVGQDAPDFTLKNTDMQDVTLSALQGPEERRVAVCAPGVYRGVHHGAVFGTG